MKNTLYFIFILSLLSSTPSCTTEENTNLYIGCYRVFDQQIPHPFFFKNKNNQLTYIDNLGEEIETAKLDSNLQSSDTIILQDHLFYFKFVGDSVLTCYDLNDTSKYLHKKKLIHKNFARYKKIKNQPLELSEVRDLLLKNSWHQILDSTNFETPNNDLAISRDWTLTKDSILFETNYKYSKKHILSETNAIPYQLFQLEGMFF